MNKVACLLIAPQYTADTELLHYTDSLSFALAGCNCHYSTRLHAAGL